VADNSSFVSSDHLVATASHLSYVATPARHPPLWVLCLGAPLGLALPRPPAGPDNASASCAVPFMALLPTIRPATSRLLLWNTRIIPVKLASGPPLLTRSILLGIFLQTLFGATARQRGLADTVFKHTKLQLVHAVPQSLRSTVA
jgi:hypothetical protein